MPLTKDLKVRMLVEIELTPEEAAAGDEPERFGGEIPMKHGVSDKEVALALETGAASVFEMIMQRGLFTKIELLD